MIGRWMVVVLVAVLLISSAVADEEVLSLEIVGDSVIASGTPVGSHVAFFDLSWVDHPWTQGFSSDVREAYSDKMNRATLKVETGIASNSVWAAVVLSDGQTAFAAAPGGTLHVEAMSSDQALIWEDKKIVALSVPGRFLEVLLVRPGGGVWSAVAGDGGASDAEGVVDGKITMSIDRFEAELGTRVQTSTLVAGDVVIAIDVNPPVIHFLRVEE